MKGLTTGWPPRHSPRCRCQAVQALAQSTPQCSTHQDAPHGFDRDASHTNDRYTCDCEGWEPEVCTAAPLENPMQITVTEAEVDLAIKAVHANGTIHLTHQTFKMALRAISQSRLTRCSLGCVEECKAKLHGYANKCPALPEQPPFARSSVSVVKLTPEQEESLRCKNSVNIPGAKRIEHTWGNSTFLFKPFGGCPQCGRTDCVAMACSRRDNSSYYFIKLNKK